MKTPKLGRFLPLFFLVLMSAATGEEALGTEDSQAGAPSPVDARLVLVLDASGSMAEEGRFGRLIDSAVTLIVSLPAKTELAVIRFNSTPTLLVPLTRLSEPARQRVIETIDNQPPPEGTTDILKAVRVGLDTLDSGGGHLVMLSDGYQLPQGGSTPPPESAWRQPVRELTADARRRGIFVHSIALGPDAEADPLPRVLAAETGGGLHRVRQPADLVSEFVGLASEIGRFWRRSKAGEFSATSATDVIQVVSAEADCQLFRIVDDRQIPLDPVLRVERNDIRAERFHLTPGRYQRCGIRQRDVTTIRDADSPDPRLHGSGKPVSPASFGEGHAIPPCTGPRADRF